ncbi:unnamed protein product [Symbiodinium natans]|uniref:Uncharacterized protein n=1 Tax=Symbiodinium natans TaxID=878477 RepID=A0A812S6T8_9DINO|nr:unnamed protein product [Symbiodinium natans]
MDPKQARTKTCTDNSDRGWRSDVCGIVAIASNHSSLEASQQAQGFVKEVEKDMDIQWRESGASGRDQVDQMSGPAASSDNLRLQEQSEFRASQDMKDAKRREAQLASQGEKSSAGLLPRRFAADLMVRFRLVPGTQGPCPDRLFCTVLDSQARMRQWHQDPSQKPPNMSMPPELAYCASEGLDELSSEGIGA